MARLLAAISDADRPVVHQNPLSLSLNTSKKKCLVPPAPSHQVKCFVLSSHAVLTKQPTVQERQKQQRKAKHHTILKKNTLVESIILTSSPAFCFKNSSKVTWPAALRGNNLPSGISFQFPAL